MAEPSEAPEIDRTRAWDDKVLNDLMTTPQGRFWVERFLEFCCIGRELYLDDGDVHGAIKRDGLAKAGRHLEGQLLDFCPDRYLQMIRERRARLGQEMAKLAREEEGRAPVASGIEFVESAADAQRSAGAAAERLAAAAKAKE